MSDSLHLHVIPLPSPHSCVSPPCAIGANQQRRACHSHPILISSFLHPVLPPSLPAAIMLASPSSTRVPAITAVSTSAMQSFASAIASAAIGSNELLSPSKTNRPKLNKSLAHHRTHRTPHHCPHCFNCRTMTLTDRNTLLCGLLSASLSQSYRYHSSPCRLSYTSTAGKQQPQVRPITPHSANTQHTTNSLSLTTQPTATAVYL